MHVCALRGRAVYGFDAPRFLTCISAAGGRAADTALRICRRHAHAMSSPASSVDIHDSLRALRELLVRFDPGCEVLADPDSNELLVRGDIDPAQLDAAIQQSGLGLRVVDPSGGGCCGSCGCG
jgi:hypothetical protein